MGTKINKLWKFESDCGRSGILCGVFIATEEQIKDLIGVDVYFGEVLGKHSEVSGTIESSDITLLTENQSVVVELLDTFGKTIAGHNPLDYISEE